MPPGRSNWPKGKVERPHVPCPICGAMLVHDHDRVSHHLYVKHGELPVRTLSELVDSIAPKIHGESIEHAIAEYDRLVAEGTIVERARP